MGDANAISLRDNANVTVQNGGTVSSAAANNNGLYNTGANTIEFRNNGTLTVNQGGQVLATGFQGSAEAVNPQGSGNLIVNNGTIKSNNTAAIWFQNTSGLNTIINNATGIIQAPGNVIGASGNGAVDFTNKGQIIGNLVFSGGNDTLRLYTGSVITGNFDGGKGNNTIFLSGTGSSSLPGNMTNFSSLIKNDSGTWTLTGTVTGVTFAEVQQGTLALTGNNSGYTGQVLVDAAGTLEARAQSLPPSVVDNGLVRFVQPDNGTYTGFISGTGAVEKTQGGTLVLAPTAAGGNTYSGGTTLTGGTVAVGVDNALGANTGGLTFNGGTLQLLQSFDLSNTRAVTINAPGGTIDTQGFTSTLTQGMTGSGSFNKAGTGTLTLAGSNTYSGGTTISAGTLQLGNGGSTGSIVGDVANNGSLVFNRSDTLLFPGTISGTGSVNQAGSGATVLTGNNSYGGGTSISAGTLQLGNAGTTGSIVGDVVNNGTLVFNRSDDVTFAGAISGTGSVTQAGAGMTVLNTNNPYTGGTNVAAGILAVGDASHAAATLSGGGNTIVASGAMLGGYGSVTGSVNNNGTIAVANAVPQFAGSGKGNFTINGPLTNAGLVQIGGQGIGNRLNVVGNYVGQNGSISLNTFLAGDGAASDRLVINGGTASGSSSLRITNVGGPGAAIVADGIEVVQAVNGATTTASAFALAGPVKAGAYSYYLAKGGVTSGTSENWYLRNTVTSTPPIVEPPAEIPPAVPPTTPSTGPETTPLYRPEVPIYAEVPSVARQLNIQQLDNFHDRQGEQSLLIENGELPAAWGRVWGSHTKQRQDGTVSPQFDGSMTGMQVGHDLYADTSASGQRNHYGLFVGFAHATGNVNGFALAVQNLDVGNVAIDAYSLGGYWTHIGPSGWYTDAVLMGSSLSADPRSHDGVGAHTHGSALLGSVEGGLPISLGAGVTIEPQAQVIWQNLAFNDLNDGVSTVSFNNGNTFLARLGVRLQSRFETSTTVWQPYLRLNLLRSSGSHDTTTFDGTTVISNGTHQTAGQLNAGLVATINKSTSVFVTATYTTNLGGAQQRTAMADAGMRWSW
ncbi:outer membrane autotransporter barrel domain protein [Collimonas arenae]|uniref:Outer membrane autotransporter barrel domain protein n=1 Tax=Collimonas arenae TaxID=279058 RepID=A0A127PR19_9BURK|nr:outer membrane autotransporter barrel domain protein [Collimonas arenae]AMP10063.1 outer membrane autotransporter barrel domain protein [Collimonas arenae]